MKFKLFFLILSFGTILYPAGFALYEHSARATGLAGAYAASAEDPGALFYNPAGIAFQKFSFYLETTVIAPSSKFYGANPYPGEGVSEKMKSQYFFPSNFSLVAPLGKNFTFGIGMFNPFGLGTEWEKAEEFSGRYLATKADVRGYNFATALAYNLKERFGVSIGLHYFMANLDLEQYVGAINPYTQTYTNIGHVRMDGGNNGKWGYDFGLLYKFNDKWQMGFSYHSKAKVSFDGYAKFKQIYTGYPDFDAMISQVFPAGKHPVETSIVFPTMAFIGISTKIIENFRFELNIGWTEWSAYDKLEIEFKDDPSLNSTHHANWEDVYNYRLGIEYFYNEKISLRTGFVYDDTPQPNSNMNPMLPDADRVGFCLGFGMKGEKLNFDLGYMYLSFKERSTKGLQQDGFNGKYENKANLLGMSLTYKF